MENFQKYEVQERRDTSLLIDEPAIVFLGRTFPEIVSSLVTFVAFAYFDFPYLGLGAAFLLGYVIPLYRIKFNRGFAQHFLWSLGLYNPQEVFPLPQKRRFVQRLLSLVGIRKSTKLAGLAVFSFKRSISIFGP